MVLKRRRRVVTFRLSDEEYETLKQGYVESDFRSISEFARAAVLERLSVAGAPQGLLVGNLVVVTRELSDLDKALSDLRDHIRRVLGIMGPECESGTNQ